MKIHTFYLALTLVTGYCTLSAAAYAQQQPDPTVPDTPVYLRSQSEPEFENSKTPEAKTERIHIEDNGTQIDELRVRGETQSIRVTPNGNLPAYEVIPNNPSSDRNGGGKRVWRVLNF